MIALLRKSNGKQINIIKSHKTNGPRLPSRNSNGHSNNIIANFVITEVNNYGSKKD